MANDRFMRLWAGHDYARLAGRFPAGDEPRGIRFERQSIEFGDRLRYKHVRVIITHEGLYVRIIGIILATMPRLFIPWDEISGSEKTRLYMRPARRLRVGEPQIGAIVVWDPVYIECLPHLPASLRRRGVQEAGENDDEGDVLEGEERAENGGAEDDADAATDAPVD
jgi:hypothetical protein